MRLTVFGCAGTFPGPDSPSSSYLVEHDGYRLLLDAGSGAVGAMQRYHPTGNLVDVDVAVLSHLHGDHWLDLIPYAYARLFAPSGTPPKLPVHSPPGLPERLSCVGTASVIDAYEVRTISTGTVHLGPLRVTFARTAHPVECYAVRVSAGGRTLVYSADTGPCEELVNLANGADTLLCEASNADGAPHPPRLHLTGRQAGEHAEAAGVGRLLLTHIVPYGQPERARRAAGEAYDGPVDLARSGATYEI